MASLIWWKISHNILPFNNRKPILTVTSSITLNSLHTRTYSTSCVFFKHWLKNSAPLWLSVALPLNACCINTLNRLLVTIKTTGSVCHKPTSRERCDCGKAGDCAQCQLGPSHTSPPSLVSVVAPQASLTVHGSMQAVTLSKCQKK